MIGSMIGAVTRRPERLLPAVTLALAVAAFLSAPLQTGRPLASFDVYNAFQGFAQIGHGVFDGSPVRVG